MTCPAGHPIPDTLLACPLCLGVIEVPAGPATVVDPVTLASTPRLIVKAPPVDIMLLRRESGRLSARMVAGDELGKNILAGHRFETAKRARVYVQEWLDEQFSQPVAVRWVEENV
jgi:hypothetical protein